MSFSLDLKVLNPNDVFSEYRDGEVILEETESGLFEWNVTNNMQGKWYTFRLNSVDSILGSFNLIDTDFRERIGLDSEQWVCNEDVNENHTPLIIIDKYFNSVIFLLEKAINMSEINSLLLIPHYQGEKTELIQGPMPIRKFIKI